MDQRDRTPERASDSEAARQPSLLVGSPDGTVALLRAETGAIIWRRTSHREIGTLAHDGTRCYIAFGSRLRLIQGAPRRETREQELRRHDRIRAEPSVLEARDALDGRLLWRMRGWNFIGYLGVGVTAQTVLVASTSVYGEQGLRALDAATGAPLWTYPTTSSRKINSYRFAAQQGRIYLYGEGGGLLVLDARTGAPLWQRDTLPDLVFSPDGSIVLERAWLPDNGAVIRVLDPATGLVRAEHTPHGTLRAVSNQGIAFLSVGTFEDPGIFAVRLEDDAELWRADDIVTFQLAVTDTAIYCGGLITPQDAGVAEVVALDALTGRRLWRWRTPPNLRSLLALWGMRTPRMLAYAGYHASANVVSALRQPGRRNIANDLLREIQDGQWRRPHALHGAINAIWLSAGWGTVYLGTRLGLFALRASDGRLLWHALPATDLSFVAPALTPE